MSQDLDLGTGLDGARVLDVRRDHRWRGRARSLGRRVGQVQRWRRQRRGSGQGPRREVLARPRVQDVRTVRIRRVVDEAVPPQLARRLAEADGGPDRRGVTPLSGPALAPGGPLLGDPVPVDDVPRWMRTAGGYAWRILAMAGVVGLVVFATSRVQIVFVAVFLGLVLTSVLRPVVNRVARVVPRPLATAITLLGAAGSVAALLAYVVNSVASQWPSLADQFSDGTGQILAFLENREGRMPITVTPEMLTAWVDTGRAWVADHGGDLASNALASAGSVAEVFGAVALGLFCSVFFLARGTEMWTWFLNQLPARTRQTWHDAGGAGWYTFAGYARGTVIIALADGILAGVVLALLGVPLAAPLGVLVFIGAFVPLVGAPLAMLVAMVVALAANGVLSAVLVGVAIALIGQFEGHVLQPLVMGRQVSLHPVVVALAVTAGTLLSGIVGAIVAVPLVAVAWAVYAKLRNVDPPLSAPLPMIKVTRARPSRASSTDVAA